MKSGISNVSDLFYIFIHKINISISYKNINNRPIFEQDTNIRGYRSFVRKIKSVLKCDITISAEIMPMQKMLESEPNFKCTYYLR